MKFGHSISYQSEPIFGTLFCMYFYSIIPLPDKIGCITTQVIEPTLSNFRAARKYMIALYRAKYEI